jgi:hypothetical protein
MDATLILLQVDLKQHGFRGMSKRGIVLYNYIKAAHQCNVTRRDTK